MRVVVDWTEEGSWRERMEAKVGGEKGILLSLKCFIYFKKMFSAKMTKMNNYYCRMMTEIEVWRYKLFYVFLLLFKTKCI